MSTLLVPSDTSPPESRCTTSTQQEDDQIDNIPDQKTLTSPVPESRCITPTHHEKDATTFAFEAPQFSSRL